MRDAAAQLIERGLRARHVAELVPSRIVSRGIIAVVAPNFSDRHVPSMRYGPFNAIRGYFDGALANRRDSPRRVVFVGLRAAVPFDIFGTPARVAGYSFPRAVIATRPTCRRWRSCSRRGGPSRASCCAPLIEFCDGQRYPPIPNSVKCAPKHIQDRQYSVR
jgi:hypothetical protein